MDKVKSLIANGARTATAIREALFANDLTVVAFADKYELPEKAVSNSINGNVRATDKLVAALAMELGGTADEWRLLLWEAAKPEIAA